MTLDLLNPQYTSPEAIKQLTADFQNGFPYKHIVLDNFLKTEIAADLYENFPAVEKLHKHYDGLNEKKSEGSNFEDFSPVFSQVRNFVMGEDFAKWMAVVTGIEGVFVTDDKLGTGLHQGGNGSFLDIHVDFSIHHVKNVHRRLNMLIYLNKNWQESYGGGMEMWNADMTKLEKKVLPLLNRCLIFETNQISYHGYSTITIPENETRKSFYTYFYTPITEEIKVKYHDTIFKPKPEDSTVKKITTNLKETAKNTIKGMMKDLGILK
ncbi:MAG: 2OG-Fe(II) oxygenase [Verrucomicrobia bacterium]|nr:2OG-Fe(II) oxygenase [Cytophagales bacterium]